MSACMNPECIQECGTLRGQIRDLQRTVAFFASVIKSGEGWSEECAKAWSVTLEPCVHDFHRAEHGIMPCTLCGADAPPPAPGAGSFCDHRGDECSRCGWVRVPPPPRAGDHASASDQTGCSCACARHPSGGCECHCIRHPGKVVEP